MGIRLLDLTNEQLRQAVLDLGEKAFRAKQLTEWVYRKGVTEASQMSNLPRTLVEKFDILTSHVACQAESSDGTVKLLIEYPDGAQVETVLIPTEDRNTACLSTQAGCAMGCKFCASTQDGLQRNLTGGEILEQIFHLQQQTALKVTNVVFMGMGEPLANYDATVAAVKAIIDPDRLGISARKVTVSTVGLPAQIRRLADEDLAITLAISLHAPNDRLRGELIPASSQTPLAEIIRAAEMFFAARKREVTLEYLLLGGVNDSPECADELVKLARHLRCNVNLIRYNPVKPLPFHRPEPEAVDAFAERLRAKGVNVTVRRSRGLDASAACGQLRRRANHSESK